MAARSVFSSRHLRRLNGPWETQLLMGSVATARQSNAARSPAGEAQDADLDAEARSLERALASLGEGVGAKRRPGRPRKRASVAAAPPQRKRARRKGKGGKGKRAPRGQRREQFLAVLQKSPGAKVSEIAKQLGISATRPTPSPVASTNRKRSAKAARATASLQKALHSPRPATS